MFPTTRFIPETWFKRFKVKPGLNQIWFIGFMKTNLISDNPTLFAFVEVATARSLASRFQKYSPAFLTVKKKITTQTAKSLTHASVVTNSFPTRPFHSTKSLFNQKTDSKTQIFTTQMK